MGANTAHLLGYLSPVSEEELTEQRAQGTDAVGRRDLVGRAGLERQYDDALRGASGIRTVSVDHRGRVSATVDEQPATAGNHLVTSIDAGIQAAAEKQLQAAIDRARSRNDRTACRTPRRHGSCRRPGSPNRPNRRVGQLAQLRPRRSGWAAFRRPTTPRSPARRRTTPTSRGRRRASSRRRPRSRSCRPRRPSPPATTSTAATPARADFRVGNRDVSQLRVVRVRADLAGARARGLLRHRVLPVRVRAVEARRRRSSTAGGRGHVLADGTGLRLRSADRHRPTVGIHRPYRRSRLEAADLGGHQGERAAVARTEGYPDVAADDPERAAYLQQIARDNCVDGFKYRGGDAVNFAIGQGDTTVTPLQLAVAYGAIANGGTLWDPAHRSGRGSTRMGRRRGHYAIARRDPARGGGDARLHPDRALRHGPRRHRTRSIRWLSARRASGGVKTGTGEVFGKQTTSWFASFDDRYAVVLMVEQGGTGAGDLRTVGAGDLRGDLRSGRANRRSCQAGCRPTTCPRSMPAERDGAVMTVHLPTTDGDVARWWSRTHPSLEVARDSDVPPDVSATASQSGPPAPRRRLRSAPRRPRPARRRSSPVHVRGGARMVGDSGQQPAHRRRRHDLRAAPRRQPRGWPAAWRGRAAVFGPALCARDACGVRRLADSDSRSCSRRLGASTTVRTRGSLSAGCPCSRRSWSR